MINLLQKSFYLFAISLLFTSCANKKMHLAEDIKRNPIVEAPDGQTIIHSVYLIGDAGDATDSEANSAVKLLKTHLNSAPENSSVLFLGDNVYPVGVPPKSKKKKRAEAESHLDAQVDLLENFKGQSIFIPGNHDWYKYGVKGLHRQEKYVEKKLNKGFDDDDDDWTNNFLPDNGCPGPELIEVNDQLIFIIVDSQWWLTDWDHVPNINDGCEFKTRAAFAKSYSDLVRKNKYKNIVVALHHPIYTNGIHGGNYTVKNHIFPLTSFVDDFYLPLPVVGSVFQFLRGAIGSRQDVVNSLYKELVENMVEPAETHGEFIFVSGHEHSLQYIKKQGQHFIVSGAGSKKSATRKKRDTPFSFGHEGFSKIDFYEDGSAWLEFWIPNNISEEGKLLFRQKIKGALPDIDKDTPTEFPEYTDQSPTISKKPILTNIKPVGRFQSWMLGDHYRDIYLENFDFPKLDLAKYQGGVKVLIRGGGMQTNSLRLQNPDGQQYVMRSLTKDVTRGIPYPFNSVKFITFLFGDTYLASQPFAPLAIPTFAKAVDVFYANSEIYYIPKQPVLGGYNQDFGQEVYITEERAAKDWRNLPSFGNSKKIISTPDMALKMQKNDKHIVDQNWVARSRLFDLLIGDWDRHDDQWRWSSSETDDGKKLYRPIPRDRDQAFSKYDGFLIPFLRPWSHFLKQLPDYTEEMVDMKWAIYNTRHFDHYFLNELSLEEWKKEAEFIKTNLTDEIIEQGFKLMPKKAYDLSAAEMSKVLKHRRDIAVDIAEKMYRQLAKQVGVHGSEKRDYFEIIRQDDKNTLVNIYKLSKKGNKKDPYYQRVFKTSETQEIYLFGLGDDDEFHIEGEVKKSIKIHVIGGAGKDNFVDQSKVSGAGKKTKVYDSKEEKNTFTLNSEAANKTSTISRQNTYNRRGKQYDANLYLPVPILGYNANDGFLIGFSLGASIPGFNKYPYSKIHHFAADFSSATSGFRVEYSGQFMEVANHWDFVINLKGKSDRSTFNYFGLGNESLRITDDLDFNRVAQSSIYLDLGFQKRFSNNNGRFSIRPLLSITDIKKEADTFISSEDSGLTEQNFEAKFYGGLVSGIYIENKDDPINPKNGIDFETELGWKNNLENNNENLVTFGSNFTLYTSFGKKERLTFATKVGSEIIRGDYQFFQAPTIGRGKNIRGIRPERYRGASTFYHLNDLRLEVLDSKNTTLPFSLGLIGSFDHGRLWDSSSTSDRWHYSYGGGLWVAPLNLILLSVTYHLSEDDQQLVIHASQAF